MNVINERLPFCSFFVILLRWHCTALKWVLVMSNSSVILLNTSIYPFMFSPDCRHAGWEMEKSALAAEESKSVLPQSVTNASLDSWRGHSSLLSHSHNVPLHHLLMHALFHKHAADAVMCCMPPHICTVAHGHTIMAWRHYWLLSTADTPICSIYLTSF